MPTHKGDKERIALLQGTLDVLILKTLLFAPCHGQGIARSIQRQSEEVFLWSMARYTWRFRGWKKTG